jgi:hypothetical protein
VYTDHTRTACNAWISLFLSQAFISPPRPHNVEDNDTLPPLKFGILGAAAIAPPALVLPAKSHPEVELYAVAARDISRAEKFAKKHGFKKWYGGKDGYQGRLDNMPHQRYSLCLLRHNRTSR